jgi:hypothetical protein
MNKKNQLLTGAFILALFLLTIPALTPKAYAAATPCSAPTTSSKCKIVILAPGGALNSNSTVAPTFLLSFFVQNFTLVQPGTVNDVDTVTTGANPHNEGHIHVFVDSVYVTIWTNGNGIPFTLSPGTHTISLHLVNDFHQEFSPQVNATTTLTVKNIAADNLQSSVNMAQTYGIGAIAVSVITLLLVAYVVVRKPKP